MTDRKPLSTGLLALDAPSNATDLFPAEERVRYYRARAVNGRLVYLKLDHHDLEPRIKTALCAQLLDFLDKSTADPLPVIVEVSGDWTTPKMLSGKPAIVMDVTTSSLVRDRAQCAPFIQHPAPKLAAA
jgi:hypothetical protein